MSMRGDLSRRRQGYNALAHSTVGRAGAARPGADAAAGFQGRSERALSGAASGYRQLSNTGMRLLNRGASYAGGALDRASGMARVSPQQWADQAATDVRGAVSRGMEAQDRSLSRMGVNPNSGRFAGMRRRLAITGAAAEAGAMNRARLAGHESGFRNEMAVAGAGAQMTGMGLSAQQAGTAGTHQVGRDYGALAGDAAYDAATAPIMGMIDALLHDSPVLEDL